MKVLETERLVLRRVTQADAPFILVLVNEPAWLRFIGDRGVKTLEDAWGYIRNGPQVSYERHGFGLYLVERKSDGAPLGMCGLLKRDSLEHVDIGYALLPAYWGQGYAQEAVSATLAHGLRDFGLKRIAAIVSNDNASSIKVLSRLGLRFEKHIRLPGATEEISLYLTPP
ncbi:GNAT family N-acetyltransferase [Myxococcus sp. CA051A]|uniref:GNAT family N-acetyltransferase n=1 Tax=Myxococcus llanfairpwllgwyngyllgogerychwyrndrobwllllantysiliogogogochensis TaxID=2590453 RepID=A0A540WIX1_9BACT|nr:MULTISPECIES: GNAT family N-acetyltransferase [Myxococcus]NTX08163.1 GNAT family N-acetyltransferase [Myxococcus sp. CA040A]NTX13557.1 GNAT family N-acetyltransferase [Myxococcus sp. CA056]NTX38853.1 GNAT family N-acetyltransferase [Myxococcus sp. CA033]NTX67419.1 GNAT family N-acetyltransferase [Myxococcus sp. CA051A]TQF08952.1 GNAT family N-acetyltransferase [Myxococcus llanfairpwllgwyngyllgogerychwyrndrobwllllantysiliogogogochensis]